MGHGLSAFQKQVMKELRRKGILSLFDLVEMRLPKIEGDLVRRMMVRSARDYSLDMAKRQAFGEQKKVYGDQPCRAWRHSKSIYRSMASLEKRGRVASIVNLQPRCWVHIRWVDDDHIAMSKRAFQNCSSKHIAAISRKGWILRSEGKMFLVKSA
jgi:hypothetical protein